MTAEEQARARQSAIAFVRRQRQPGDQVAVLVAGNGSARVVQDFTADASALEAAIVEFAVEPGDPPGDTRVASIEAAARILGAVEGKKALIYFTSRAAFDREEVRHTTDRLVQSNIAFFPIDVRGLPGAKAMAPSATYTGVRSIDATVAAALARELQAGGTAVVGGFPGGDATMDTYPAGEAQQLSVPLGSLAGTVDIVAQVGPNSVAVLRDAAKAPAVYRGAFTLPAGSYTCAIVVRDRTTGQVYGETIAFEVK
jgi:hypothetical protein